MEIRLKSLSLDSIEHSAEIQSWLRQFAAVNRHAATSIISRLQFVDRDQYGSWLLDKLATYANGMPHAVYAVRKFSESPLALWGANGGVVPRPPATLGSEDFIASILSQATKQHRDWLYDHPSLQTLREHRIHNMVLLDDSIGSGKRVGDFIRLMTNHPTFKSWWSYGVLKLHVVSLARTTQSEVTIRKGLAGSDHGKRKRRSSDKLRFDSDYVYDALDLRRRWGEMHESIADLCDSTTAIPSRFRRGYGRVMGNLVFYHSVPNNIPGTLFSSSGGWRPIFPDRTLPGWCSQLIDSPMRQAGTTAPRPDYQNSVPEPVVELLANISSGIRTKSGLARRLDLDKAPLQQMLAKCVRAGLLSEEIRLTPAGLDALRTRNSDRIGTIRDRSLYVPTSWCTDQGTAQPSVPEDV